MSDSDAANLAVLFFTFGWVAGWVVFITILYCRNKR
jgi:hypothetical protein